MTGLEEQEGVGRLAVARGRRKTFLMRGFLQITVAKTQWNDTKCRELSVFSSAAHLPQWNLGLAASLGCDFARKPAQRKSAESRAREDAYAAHRLHLHPGREGDRQFKTAGKSDSGWAEFSPASAGLSSECARSRGWAGFKEDTSFKCWEIHFWTLTQKTGPCETGTGTQRWSCADSAYGNCLKGGKVDCRNCSLSHQKLGIR